MIDRRTISQAQRRGTGADRRRGFDRLRRDE